MGRTVSLGVFIIGLLVALAIGAVSGVLGYVYFVGGSGEASREVTAATIAPETPESSTDGEAPDAGSTVTFTIVPDESEISFTLQEDLMNARTVVVGRSNQVTGNIAVDFASPQNSAVGAMEINLRTLSTDNEFRNRAIRDQILQSNRSEYEFTTFTPLSISGLPDTVAVGDTFSFTLTGELPIRQITQEVTWDVSVTVVSETRLEGTATAQVLRSQYDLVIPAIPSVSNVTDEVDLKIDFVAIAQ